MRYSELLHRFIASGLILTMTLPTLPAAPVEEPAAPPKVQRANWSAKGFTEEQKKHWAYQPVKPAVPPAVKNSGWVRTPVDAFILAKLEQQGLTPSPEADRSMLIRRATLDITGLLPTPEEVEAFTNDKSPQAYENLIERLLA